MPRINNKDLEVLCDRLNEYTKAPLRAWDKDTKKANIGNYHISGAYDGVSLHRICNDGGGIHDVLRSGHIPKRDLYNRMQAYIMGLEI